MQKSLQFFWITEEGKTPYWRALYGEADKQGNVKQRSMSVLNGSQDEANIHAMISQVEMYQPDAPPDVLSQTKARKIALLTNEWNNSLKSGWDSGRGKLGMASEDVALFSAAYALAKEASALNLSLPSFITIDNQQIDFASLQEMTNMMLAYGAARAELSKTFASRIRTINNATTPEQIENA